MLEVAASLAKFPLLAERSPLLAKDARNGAPTDGATAAADTLTLTIIDFKAIRISYNDHL